MMMVVALDKSERGAENDDRPLHDDGREKTSLEKQEEIKIICRDEE